MFKLGLLPTLLELVDYLRLLPLLGSSSTLPTSAASGSSCLPPLLLARLGLRFLIITAPPSSPSCRRHRRSRTRNHLDRIFSLPAVKDVTAATKPSAIAVGRRSSTGCFSFLAAAKKSPSNFDFRVRFCSPCSGRFGLGLQESHFFNLSSPIAWVEAPIEAVEMASYLWRKYADYLYTKWEKTFLWDMVEPYRRPKSFTPLVTIYIAAFYTGVVGAAINEQLYKEKYWEEHPGRAVPLMQPKFYWGPWRIMRGDVPRSEPKAAE